MSQGSNSRKTLGVGLIGTGFMGKAHALGYSLAPKIFDLGCDLSLQMVADQTQKQAESAAKAYGFTQATSNWRDLLENPRINIISITAPNALHRLMAMEAIAAGKHVYCEKPLAPTASDAELMSQAAEKARVKTQVGFNYLCNPLLTLAKDMIKAGELGQIRGFRGLHAEDYMADARAPFTFRHDPAGGGALADLGSHVLATAEFLLGPISRVMGDCLTVIDQRPGPGGAQKPVEVDDIARAFLRFESGASGSIEANWLATGRKMQHNFEIYGDKGAISFTQERFNELHYFTLDDKFGRQGFRRIEAGPEHQPYGLFCVAPGHQLGFNDLKTIEIAGFIQAINDQGPEPFNFHAGLRIQTLVESIQRSARQACWIPTERALPKL